MAKHRSAKTNPVKPVAVAALASAAIVVAPGTANAAEASWGPIIACESGGNPTAQNPVSTASGLFQFIDGTWKSYGGSTSKAKHASVAEQYEVANRAFAKEGYRPWNSSKGCWGPKMGTVTGPQINPKPRSQPPKVQVPETEYQGRHRAPEGNYTVKPGDTLSGIAAPNGMTWQELYEKNRDVVENADLIFPGESLNVT